MCVIMANGHTAGLKSSATIWQLPGHSESVTSLHSNILVHLCEQELSSDCKEEELHEKEVIVMIQCDTKMR